MPEHARITSIEALENFRNSLIVYLEKTTRAVDEIDEEIVSTHLWLQSDRRVYWESQVRRWTTELEIKQQELFSARISNLQTDTIVEQKAVQKAMRALNDAIAKRALVKQHSRQYENRVAPMAKEIDKMRGFLIRDMRKAVAWLNQAIKMLHAYADTRTSHESGASDGKSAVLNELNIPNTTTGGEP